MLGNALAVVFPGIIPTSEAVEKGAIFLLRALFPFTVIVPPLTIGFVKFAMIDTRI
jgi:hypothetical protein